MLDFGPEVDSGREGDGSRSALTPMRRKAIDHGGCIITVFGGR